jgi:hypothetical protein
MSNMEPYRAPPRVETSAAPPAMWFHDVRADGAPSRLARPAGLAALAATLSGLAWLLVVNWPLGAALIAVVVAGAVASWRSGEPGMSVDEATGAVALRGASKGHPRVVPLTAIRDVTVERRSTHHFVAERPGMPLPAAGMGFESERGRIVVTFDGDAPPYRFVERYAPSFEADERVAKARTFLRAHGWVPAGERASGAAPRPRAGGAG